MSVDPKVPVVGWEDGHPERCDCICHVTIDQQKCPHPAGVCPNCGTHSDERQCSVEGCEHPALTDCPCCYGHTVDADDPRHIPTPKLPTVADLTGSDPDFAGGLSAPEYVRRLRGYDAPDSDEIPPAGC